MTPLRRDWFGLQPGNQLRDVADRRLWTRTVVGSFGSQVTMRSLPLSAAVQMPLTPARIGCPTASGILLSAPFSPCLGGRGLALG